MSLILSLDAPPAPTVPLVGRALMLNTEKAPRFQCGGFLVSRNNPIQIVSPVSQELPLRQALFDGRLIDITGQSDAGALGGLNEVDKAVKDGTFVAGDHGAEETPILMGKDNQGNSYMLTPKDPADYERMQAEIRETGHLRVAKPKPIQFTGLSSIYEESVLEF